MRELRVYSGLFMVITGVVFIVTTALKYSGASPVPDTANLIILISLFAIGIGLYIIGDSVRK